MMPPPDVRRRLADRLIGASLVAVQSPLPAEFCDGCGINVAENPGARITLLAWMPLSRLAPLDVTVQCDCGSLHTLAFTEAGVCVLTGTVGLFDFTTGQWVP